MVQPRRVVELQERAGHLPPELAPGQKKPREPLWPMKNNSHLPRSLRAWAALGTEVPMKRQAFPAEETSLPA